MKKYNIILLFTFILILMPLVSSASINLYHLNYSISDVWILDESNNITLFPLDLNNSAISVTNINISIIENITHSEGEIFYIPVGIYYKEFTFSSSNINTSLINNVTFNIIVEDNGKIIQTQYNVMLIPQTKFEILHNKFNNFINNFYRTYILNINIYWIPVTILFLLSIVIIILFEIFFKLKK